MVTRVAPLRAIYRHSQDTPTNCGRACGQMVIASLVMGPPPGTQPTPGEETAPISVLQATLQQAEQFPVDDLTKPAWFTHPDELWHVLKTAPDLNLPNQNYSQWRLGNHATLDDLLADVYLTLKGGMPAIINIRGSDHWVVVASIDADNDAVLAVQMLDSLYDDFNPGSAGHTYMDNCGLSSDGNTWWQPWSLSAANLASYEVAIGTVPPPTGLTNFAGRFVGVMYGQAPSGTGVITEKTKVARKKRPKPKGRTQVERVRAELERFATEFAGERLARLLDPPLPMALRQVRDIQHKWAPYTLVSGFRAELEQGFVAAFDPADDVLMHFRFLKGPQVTQSLQGDADEPLWWTREFVPSLPSPYFPYRRSTDGGQAVFRRVIDGEPLIQVSTSI